MNPASFDFNYHSARAARARLGVKFEGSATLLGLKTLAVLSFLGGIGVVIELHTPFGWLLCIPGSIALTILLWYQYDLKELAPNGVASVDGLVERDLLGRLPTQPTPKDIAALVTRLPGGRFYASRFAINPESIGVHSSPNAVDAAAIWQRAYQIAQQHNLTTINSHAVMAALIILAPGVDQYLAQLQLDEEDILAGVGWQAHLAEIVKAHKEPPLYGGIARDWAFGFTPLLERFGINLTQQVQTNGLLARNLEGHQNVIDQTLHVLSNSARRNAVLVGNVGAGKSTMVQMLAERLIDPDPNEPPELRYNQVIALDPATLISRAGGRGELENLVQQLFVEALRAKNIILFLDDAQLFLEDGTGAVNLSNILLPVLEGGALRVILAMDQQRWLQLTQTNPALGQLLNMVPVQPLDQASTMKVMEDQLILLEHQARVTYMYQTMREAYHLAERYIPDQVMPGRALKLLEASARFAENGFVSPHSAQTAIEQSYGIKVTNANNAQERETLLNLEQLIHERMINQTRAVKVVSDALRRARTGVRNQSRPIGTFLFLGPTGVGKTELAKSLAAVYFGGEDHLVRVDLNEYVRSEDLIRFIATGAEDPHSLAAQITRQPFSVVLLDEIEKAHPDVLSALLQLLDEGILRDSSNREVSFRDAIVIATSNAGAQSIREHIERGEQVEQFEEQLTNELINSNQFRPEFLNRFDEIVVFRPLTMPELMQVIDLIIASINKTLAQQKVSVVLTDPAKQMLVQQGYDPRLGARPLRRVVQRTVENIMAQRMLGGQITPGQQVVLDTPDIQAVSQS
jgi:ATP-dependent Clp protease ATP-binding subunit ClpC